MTSPRFKRGSPSHYKMRYVKLGPKANECFVNLVENRTRHIKYSYGIRLAMSDKPLEWGTITVRGRQIPSWLASVDAKYATYYRRAFDALGLVEDIPGVWNPEKFRRPKFSHDNLDEGYESYTDWASMNYPAELYLLADDPNAYASITEGHDIYVLSRNFVAPDGYDNSQVGYADNHPRSLFYFYPKEWESSTQEWGVQTHSHNNRGIYLCNSSGIAHLPSTVLLVKHQTVVWSHRRSRSPSCLMALMQRSLSVPELVEMTGMKRRTVYDWIKKGKAIRVDGKYWCNCHPLAEYVDLSVGSEQVGRDREHSRQNLPSQ